MDGRIVSAIRCASPQPLQSLFPLLRTTGACATLLDPQAIFSIDQLELAAAQARKSMADGTAVSDRLEMEMLMWLAGTTHAQKAISTVGAKEQTDFVLVVVGEGADASALAKKLGLMERKASRIGSDSALSRMGVKSAQRLYEKMALSRIQA